MAQAGERGEAGAARRTMTSLNARRRKQDGTEPSTSPSHDGSAPLLAEGSEATPTWDIARFDRRTRYCTVERGTSATLTQLPK